MHSPKPIVMFAEVYFIIHVFMIDRANTQVHVIIKLLSVMYFKRLVFSSVIETRNSEYHKNTIDIFRWTVIILYNSNSDWFYRFDVRIRLKNS